MPILKPLTTNEFTLKYSLHFAEEIVDQQPDFFMDLLFLAAKDTHFIFDGTLHKQIDGVAMGSPKHYIS